MMNVLWARLGVCAKDVIFSQESKYLCELGDPSEFVAYGEARCRELGIEDDAQAANFLYQAFHGDVKLWCDSLPQDMRASWFLLKQALLEEFGNGQVMESMELLCQVWWQVPNYEQCFDVLWKVYERVSFFHGSFVHLLKERMVQKQRIASMQLQALSKNHVMDVGIEYSMHNDAMGMNDGFKDAVGSQEVKRCSSSSSVHDESEAMDDLSSDEATSFFDEESLYASSTSESEGILSVVNEESMHVALEDEASFEGHVKKDISLMIADAMEFIHKDETLNDTRGVGKEEDLMHRGFKALVIDAGKEEDLWSISSFDELEPMIEMDAFMASCVKKATLRIEEALQAKGDTLLKAYETMHEAKFMEEQVHVEGYTSMNVLEGEEMDDAFLLVDEANHSGKVDKDTLAKQRCQNELMMMVMYVTVQYAMQEFCDIHEVKGHRAFSFQMVEADNVGEYAHGLECFVPNKAPMPRLIYECKCIFSFDPGGRDWHVLRDDWETRIWPFDPGGCRYALLLLIMNDLAG